jgi:hypothetical protein
MWCGGKCPEARKLYSYVVMAGLDPAIHRHKDFEVMDPRIKSAGDGGECGEGITALNTPPPRCRAGAYPTRRSILAG